MHLKHKVWNKDRQTHRFLSVCGPYSDLHKPLNKTEILFDWTASFQQRHHITL